VGLRDFAGKAERTRTRFWDRVGYIKSLGLSFRDQRATAVQKAAGFGVGGIRAKYMSGLTKC